MAANTTGAYTGAIPPAGTEKDYQTTAGMHENANGFGHNHHTGGPINGMNHEQQDHAYRSRRDSYHDYPSSRAFGGALQPGMWKPLEHRKFANPAPLGLCAFALTTFVLSCVNLQARGVKEPNIAVPLAFAYGGLVQLLAGMWEMAVGNTFGATALSSYGGFWIAYGILLTPAWGITAPDGPYADDFSAHYSAVGFFLTGWFIFTTVLLLCTLKSTVAFFSLFFTLDIAFLFLACENYAMNMGKTTAGRNLQIVGGVFGMLAAFLAWYNALAGLQDDSNSFFRVPVIHMPWSEKGKEIRRTKSGRTMD